MPFIVWAKERGRPRILGILDHVLDSGAATRKHTYPEFARLVGKTEAQKALRRYYWEQKTADKPTPPTPGESLPCPLE